MPRRKRCRLCSGLAGVTSDICNFCRMAEVRKHIKRRSRPGVADKQGMQDAYSASLATLPPGRHGQNSYAASAIYSSVAAGLDQRHPIHSFAKTTLANAQRFAATLGGVPRGVASAQMFFSYSQKSFYNHMRAVLIALDGTKKLPGRKRKTPTSDKSRHVNARAQTTDNILLSKALRFIRLYMQMEMIPLALKIGCSKTAIWHIETANNEIFPKWVEQYACVFEIKEDRIYAYAQALGKGPAVGGCPKDMVTKFVNIVLKGKKDGNHS